MTEAPPHEDPATDVVGYLRALKTYLESFETRFTAHGAALTEVAHKVAGPEVVNDPDKGHVIT